MIDSSYKIINTYPHDTNAFTQGLLVDPRNPNYFFEGTGMLRRSQLRRVEITTGKVTHTHNINPHYFGEGIVIFGRHLYQLTWQNKKIYRYVLNDVFVATEKPLLLENPRNFVEGWGMTSDGVSMIVSDGSANLYFVNDVDNKIVVTKTIQVTYNNRSVQQLNELEYIEGYVWANVWYSDFIYVIDPNTGVAIRRVDMRGLKTSGDVLNGIAYDNVNKKIYVTGKYWPNVYEIEEVFA